ncbi:MAG TPA: hypothetical protein VK789_02740 [Bryobacteraceae bacterium]|nr:hypothetical protein [Bryobacteraceae bacterium]
MRITYTTGAGDLRCDKQSLTWDIGFAESRSFAAQIRTLAESASAGHQYLDPQSGNQRIQIVVSMGEYEPEMFLRREP